MPSVYDAIDLRFAWNGDLVLGDNQDIKDTSDNTLQSLLDQIHIVCASALEDWEIYPNKGADINSFVGEPNNRTTGDRIHDRIRLSLVAADLVQEEDLVVRVVPVHIYKVLVVINISTAPTPFNKLLDGEVLQTSLVFDTMEQSVFFLDKTPQLITPV